MISNDCPLCGGFSPQGHICSKCAQNEARPQSIWRNVHWRCEDCSLEGAKLFPTVANDWSEIPPSERAALSEDLNQEHRQESFRRNHGEKICPSWVAIWITA